LTIVTEITGIRLSLFVAVAVSFCCCFITFICNLFKFINRHN